MRRFFLRELVRLAPVAGASLLLAALVFLGLQLAPASWAFGAAFYTYMTVLVGAPWLLGAASIAPDSESGAAVFMATLPVKPWRQLAMRLSAAALYSALVPLLVYVVLDLPSTEVTVSRVFPDFEALILVPFAFGGAALSSATIRNSLTAFVLAPLFVAIPLWLSVQLAEAWGSEILLLGLCVPLPLLLLAGTWAAFGWGEQHARAWSLRTLRLGALTTLLPMVAIGGVGSAVYAYDDLYPTWRADAVSVYSAQGQQFYRFQVSHSLRGYEVQDLRWFYGPNPESLQQLPMDHYPTSISPSGSRMVLLNGWGGYSQGIPNPAVLFDMDEGHVILRGTTTQYAEDDYWPGNPWGVTVASDGLSAHGPPIVWRGEEPFQAELERVEPRETSDDAFELVADEPEPAQYRVRGVRSLDGSQRFELPPNLRVESASDRALLLREGTWLPNLEAGEGESALTSAPRWLWDLSQEEPTLTPVPAYAAAEPDARRISLSPQGRWLIASDLIHSSRVAHVRILAVGAGTWSAPFAVPLELSATTRLISGADLESFVTLHLSFDPSERWLAAGSSCGLNELLMIDLQNPERAPQDVAELDNLSPRWIGPGRYYVYKRGFVQLSEDEKEFRDWDLSAVSEVSELLTSLPDGRLLFRTSEGGPGSWTQGPFTLVDPTTGKASLLKFP